MSIDPFVWADNDEDEVRAECCGCGWFGPWRDHFKDVRTDERTHDCLVATTWRKRRPAPEPSPAEQAVIDRFGIFAEEDGQ